MADRKQLLISVLALLLTMSCAGCLSLSQCSLQRRGAALRGRVEKLTRDAREQLVIGTKEDDVKRFFQANGIPVNFDANEATGIVHAQGCAPSGCASDKATVRIGVRVDGQGTVVGEPVIRSMYTDCL